MSVLEDRSTELASREQVLDAARRARAAAATLATLTSATKDAALLAMADALLEQQAGILSANELDVRAAEAAGTPASLVDRLRLTPARIEGMADGLRQLAALPDPVGTVLRGSVLPNGLQLTQLRVPMGVVAIIYEARPNVTVDAAGIALKAGNAVLLRGSGSAYRVEPGAGRRAVAPPRPRRSPGGRRAAGARDRPRVGAAPDDRARPGRRDRPARRRRADPGRSQRLHGAGDRDRRRQLPRLRRRVGRPGDGGRDPGELQGAPDVRVQRRRDPAGAPRCRGAVRAGGGGGAARGRGDDPRRRRRSSRCAGRTGCRAGRPRTRTSTPSTCRWTSRPRSSTTSTRRSRTSTQHGTGHTEAIVTSSLSAAEQFTDRVDAAVVMVNASTAFTDGGEFGLGAEIGISTQKLHARGPMGLAELTSTKWVVIGSGQVRASS